MKNRPDEHANNSSVNWHVPFLDPSAAFPVSRTMLQSTIDASCLEKLSWR